MFDNVTFTRLQLRVRLYISSLLTAKLAFNMRNAVQLHKTVYKSSVFI